MYIEIMTIVIIVLIIINFVKLCKFQTAVN